MWMLWMVAYVDAKSYIVVGTTVIIVVVANLGL